MVGNEDGAHAIVANLFQGLNDCGYTIPAQGCTYWNGETMTPGDDNDLDDVPDAFMFFSSFQRAGAARDVEPHSEVVERIGQWDIRRGRRIGRDPEVGRRQESRQDGAGDQQHQIASGTHGGPGAERHQLGTGLGASVQPHLGDELVRERKPVAVTMETGLQDRESGSGGDGELLSFRPPHGVAGGIAQDHRRGRPQP